MGGQPLIMGSGGGGGGGGHVLSKRQKFKDSTLQNGILGQSKKNTDREVLFV